MQPYFLTIEEFNELLNEWNGRSITIVKHELDDIDETLMNLKSVSYSRNTRRLDDYEPMHALQLNGDAQIQTTMNMFESLPASLYEIPLEDSTLYEFDGSRFILSTSRGIYTIEVTD